MVFQMFFHRKNLRYHENITKKIQRYIFIFLNQKSSNEDFSYIQPQTLQKRSIFRPIQSIKQ